MTPEINIIAALSKKDRVIGNKGVIPWKISTDLKRFRELTVGQVVIMGRKTYESIGRPLPNRTNIIVTRDTGFSAPLCTVVHSIEKALSSAGENNTQKIFIIGGGEIYNQALSLADRLLLTLVDGDFEGDAYFPEYPNFKIVSTEKREENSIKFEFVILEKER